MKEFTIKATRTVYYELTVHADNEESAYAQLDGWISDDFEQHQVTAEWQFEVEER
jgi:hypothetical protein